MSARLPITPQTKVAALLDAYPELESVLVDMAPAFSKLRNPILRQTIARVTTLATAAKVGNVDARQMVRTLRSAAGFDDADSIDDERDAGPSSTPDEAEPAWVAESATVETIDADGLLASELTPLQVVMPKLRSLGARDKLHIRSSFRPEPLIEALRDKGHRVHCRAGGGDAFDTFVAGRG